MAMVNFLLAWSRDDDDDDDVMMWIHNFGSPVNRPDENHPSVPALYYLRRTFLAILDF